MGMIPVLQPLLDSPMAQHMASLQLGPIDDMTVRPVSDLLDAEVMVTTMRQFQPEEWEHNRRAVFSHWTQYYFLRFLPPALAANLLFQQSLPLALADVGVVLGDDGLPTTFVLKNEGKKLRDQTAIRDRFLLLRENHLAPLIKVWSSQAGISERVLWSNVGRYLDWILVQLQQLTTSAQAWKPLQTWLEAPYDRPGWHRRVCCLRECLTGVVMCPDCPKVTHV